MIAFGRPPAAGRPLSALLFLLIMDVLNSMADKAEAAVFFEPLDRWGVSHRLSLYADELIAIKEILALFGDTSGLKANLQKCAISQIRCGGLLPSPANRPSFLVHTWAYL